MNTIVRRTCMRMLSVCIGLVAVFQVKASDPSLILHFDFDGVLSSKVPDVTGNGHDGWNMQGTNWITSTNGVFGNTVGFWYINGLSEISEPLSTYLAVTNMQGLTNMTSMTVSVWTRTDQTAQDSAMEIISSGYTVQYSGDPTTSSNSWDLRRYFSPDFVFRLYAADGDHNLLNFPNDVISAGGTYNLTQTNWHHYAATLDCVANVVIGYHDGVPFETNAVNVPYLTVYGGSNGRWMCIGADAHDGVPQWGTGYPNDGYFAGGMDDLRIYNRMLSASEIQAIYQGSRYAPNLTIHKTGAQAFRLQWDVNTNLVYQPEFVTSLAATPWTALQSPVPGTVTNGLIDASATNTSRFYRIRILP